MHLVLSDMNNRIFGPYLAAIHRILSIGPDGTPAWSYRGFTSRQGFQWINEHKTGEENPGKWGWVATEPGSWLKADISRLRSKGVYECVCWGGGGLVLGRNIMGGAAS
jgi:hypothetical protein